MASVSSITVFRDWSSSLFRAVPENLGSFLDVTDATLPTGWSREAASQRSTSRGQLARCYRFDQAKEPIVAIWFLQVSPTRLRGGPIQVLCTSQAGRMEQIDQALVGLVKLCLVPAAGTANVCFTRPRFGPRSVLTPVIEVRLNDLADAADGAWPLVGRSQQLWDELISDCLAEQVAIDRGELQVWARESGWTPQAALELTGEFFAGSDWLAKRYLRSRSSAQSTVIGCRLWQLAQVGQFKPL